MGERLTVLTGHNSLRWLMEIKDPSGRSMLWRLQLAEYNFGARYKEGTRNLCADFASRMHTDNSIENDNYYDEIPCYSTTEKKVRVMSRQKNLNWRLYFLF